MNGRKKVNKKYKRKTNANRYGIYSVKKGKIMSLGQLNVICAYFISQCLKMESFKKP